MADASSRASYADEPWFPQVQAFADWLRNIREETGFTQQDVAELIGVSDSVISRWEHARMVPAEKAIEKYTRVFDLGTDFRAAWKDIRKRVDRFADASRALSVRRTQRRVPRRDTDPAPIGYSGAWWDPIVVETQRDADPSRIDRADDSRLFDRDYLKLLRNFDADLLIVEEFDEYEPWDGVPRRLPAPGLSRENWTAPRRALPGPSNDAERQAWKDWLDEQQEEARKEFIVSETFERARKQRRTRLVVTRERKEEMARKTFAKEDSRANLAYQMVQAAGTRGLTSHEIAVRLGTPDVTTAAALSELHEKRMIARLVERRMSADLGPKGKPLGGSIYVTVENIDGRATRPYGRNAVSEAVRNPDDRKIHLKASTRARRNLPEALRAEVENYQRESEVAGVYPPEPKDAPYFPIPWTTEQRQIINAYWEGLTEGDVALAAYLVSIQDRFKE